MDHWKLWPIVVLWVVNQSKIEVLLHAASQGPLWRGKQAIESWDVGKGVAVIP